MSKKGKSKRSHAVLDGELLALMRLVEASNYAEVEKAARRILSSRPGNHLATKALTFALIGLGRTDENLSLLDYALAKWPADPELHNNRGIVLSMLMRWNEALGNFAEALRLQPDDPEVLKNIGVAYGRMHRWNDAVPPLLKAIEVHPGDYIEAVELLAMALANGGRLDEAATCFSELWQAEKEPKYLYELYSVSMRRCDWAFCEDSVDRLRSLTNGFSTYLGCPFISLFAPGISAREQRSIAESYAQGFIPGGILAQQPSPFVPSRREGGSRLRIAYVSADFRVHPVGYVFSQVAGFHDCQHFEVFAYSVGPDDGSDVRRHYETAFDHFLDAQKLSVRELAERIRADQVDIAVDLNGWTADGRPEAFALRCAPVQVNWLGYAGTMGHEKLADYLIGDPVVTPVDHSDSYTETLALLPWCYLPAESASPPSRIPTRAEAGLPDSAFVFCSFNSAYKLNPLVIDLWSRILGDSPGSILWLSRPPSGGDERLLCEFQRRGISPDRIVYAARVDGRADHLARLSLADIALDPFPYNSHSTGIEMLQAGVPMISLLGETFPSRVGASLLRSVHLDELVVDSLDAYCALAVSLYGDSTRLLSLRQKLIGEKQGDLPLFNMRGFVSNLERLYRAMWKNHQDGTRRLIDGRNFHA